MGNQQLITPGGLPIFPQSIGIVDGPMPGEGAWEITAYVAQLIEVSYQNTTRVSGLIDPVFGGGLSHQGTGGSYVGGGGGFITSSTKNICRYVARLSDGSTTTGQADADLGLHNGGSIYVSVLKRGSQHYRLALHNPHNACTERLLSTQDFALLGNLSERATLFGLLGPIPIWLGFNLHWSVGIAAIVLWGIALKKIFDHLRRRSRFRAATKRLTHAYLLTDMAFADHPR